MKRSLIMCFMLLLGMQSVSAMDIVPRVGVDYVRQTYSYSTNPTIELKSNGGGFNAGVVLVGKSAYLDIGLESANVLTPVNSVNIYEQGWRSETSITVGFNVTKNIWLNFGLIEIAYGSSALKKERGSSQSPIVGFSFSNMQAAGYLFSVGPAFTLSPKSKNIGNADDDPGISGGLRFTWRKKGSPHLWSIKNRVNAFGASDFIEGNAKISYSYLFL